MLLLTLVFETSASTNSAIRAGKILIWQECKSKIFLYLFSVIIFAEEIKTVNFLQLDKLSIKNYCLSKILSTAIMLEYF